MPLSFHPEEKFLYPLRTLNSWRIGGLAERFFQPQNLSELSKYLQNTPESLPINWLGLGSNLLIRDAGVAGSVIFTRDLKEIKIVDNNLIYVDCGVTCSKFARICLQHGFRDAAFFAGIPGTIGGALSMNAGAFGGQTWEHVSLLNMIDLNGESITRNPDEFSIGYRMVNGLDFDLTSEGFTGAVFKFKKFENIDERNDIKQLLKKRGDSQPIGAFSCGSVFKNPQGDHAARLIEASGLKGYRQGNVGVSEKHANFILNYSDGKSEDIETLMKLIQDTIFKDSGIVLQPEVRIIGKTHTQGGDG
jgi:UDP-N-acetylmuramate dehydrogenase